MVTDVESEGEDMFVKDLNSRNRVSLCVRLRHIGTPMDGIIPVPLSPRL